MRISLALGVLLFVGSLAAARLPETMVAALLSADIARSTAYQFARDAAVAGAFSVLLLSARSIDLPAIGSTVNKIFADFSYSVYLFHVPILVFIAALAKDFLGLDFSRQPGLGTFTYFAGCLMAIYGVSYALSRVTEARTAILRRSVHSAVRKIAPTRRPVTLD